MRAICLAFALSWPALVLAEGIAGEPTTYKFTGRTCYVVDEAVIRSVWPERRVVDASRNAAPLLLEAAMRCSPPTAEEQP